MSNVIQFVFFLLSNGDGILEQVNQLRRFVDYLIDNYSDEVVSASVVDNVDVDQLATQFSGVYSACDRIEDMRPGMTADVGRRGAFRDLIRFVIENPEKIKQIIDLIMTFTK